MQALEEALDAVLTDEFPAPGIIFYNAGTDILEGDPLNHGEASVRLLSSILTQHCAPACY